MFLYALTAAIALALKAHYSVASARDLRWILAPTAAVVGWLRHEPLRFDAALGWVPDDPHFVIAPACAGVNFMILAFSASVVGFAGRFATVRARCAWLLAMLIGAYVLTIAVNAVRIVIAVALYDADLQHGWLTPERVHRLAGAVIYLGALSAAWLALDRCTAGRGGPRQPLRPSVPLLAYVGMTVVVPCLNGAWRHVDLRYLEHGLSVSLLALVAGLLLSGMRSATSSAQRRGTTALPEPRGARGEADGQSDDPGGRGRARDR